MVNSQGPVNMRCEGVGLGRDLDSTDASALIPAPPINPDHAKRVTDALTSEHAASQLGRLGKSLDGYMLTFVVPEDNEVARILAEQKKRLLESTLFVDNHTVPAAQKEIQDRIKEQTPTGFRYDVEFDFIYAPGSSLNALAKLRTSMANADAEMRAYIEERYMSWMASHGVEAASKLALKLWQSLVFAGKTARLFLDGFYIQDPNGYRIGLDYSSHTSDLHGKGPTSPNPPIGPNKAANDDDPPDSSDDAA